MVDLVAQSSNLGALIQGPGGNIMAEYQNIFTRVQVRGPAHIGVSLPRGSWTRTGTPSFSYLLGLIGDAQLGPIYLGTTGLASLICGFVASRRTLNTN